MFISSPFSFPFSFPLFILLCLRVFSPPLGPSSLLLLPLLWFSFLSTTSVPFCSLSFHLDSSHLASSHFLFFLVSCFVLSSHPFVLLIYFSLISFLSSHLFQCYVSSPYVSLVYFAFFPPPHLMSTHLLFLISLCLFSLSYLLSCNSFPFSRQEFSHQLYSPLLISSHSCFLSNFIPLFPHAPSLSFHSLSFISHPAVSFTLLLLPFLSFPMHSSHFISFRLFPFTFFSLPLPPISSHHVFFHWVFSPPLFV